MAPPCSRRRNSLSPSTTVTSCGAAAARPGRPPARSHLRRDGDGGQRDPGGHRAGLQPVGARQKPAAAPGRARHPVCPAMSRWCSSAARWRSIASCPCASSAGRTCWSASSPGTWRRAGAHSSTSRPTCCIWRSPHAGAGAWLRHGREVPQWRYLDDASDTGRLAVRRGLAAELASGLGHCLQRVRSLAEIRLDRPIGPPAAGEH